MTGMNALELRIPPAAVFAAAALLMGLIASALPTLRFAVPGHLVLAVAVMVVGGMIGVAGILAFNRAQTTIHPMKPGEATSLVTTGIYTRSRNPMYLALLLGLLAWAIYLGHPVSLLLLPGFVLYMNRFQIIPEERALEAKFGADFKAYCARVRRWV